MTPPRIYALLLVLTALLWSCKNPKDPDPVPPVAPDLLTATSITFNSVMLSWNDRSSNEEGFEIEMQVNTAWEVAGSVNANVSEFQVFNLEPSRSYRFRVFAFNNAGRSLPSNEYTVTTQSHNPPPAPTNVLAFPLAPTVVRVEWSDTAPMAVNFVIDRRSASSGWTRVGQTGDNIEAFNDSTCSPASSYYYRVGAQSNNLLTWSVDSASVTTPAIGTPQAPTNLTTTIILGTGVRLNWIDNSLDEIEFHIRRNVEGQFFVIIDTVAANTAEYLDELGANVARYNYQVRAANAVGVSGWSNIAAADYEYCSDGAVPICLENYWDYEVNPTSGPNYNVRRQIREVAYPNGVDYYLMVEFSGDSTDTLFYWRNFEIGLYQDNYPLDASPAELLLRHPPSGSFWNFQGDSVIITSSNVTLSVHGTQYTGVTIYQRFSRTSSKSVKYYLKPVTLGIIKIEEIDGPGQGKTHELIDSYIRN